MNAKAVSKDFSAFLKKQGIPNQRVVEHELDTVKVEWIEEENCPSFKTKIMFEDDTGVVFISEDFKYFDMDSKDYIMDLMFVTNDLTAEDFILSWYLNSYDNENFQVFVRHALIGVGAKSNDEYFEILSHMVSQIQENFVKLP